MTLQEEDEEKKKWLQLVLEFWQVTRIIQLLTAILAAVAVAKAAVVIELGLVFSPYESSSGHET